MRLVLPACRLRNSGCSNRPFIPPFHRPDAAFGPMLLGVVPLRLAPSAGETGGFHRGGRFLGAPFARSVSPYPVGGGPSLHGSIPCSWSPCSTRHKVIASAVLSVSQVLPG